MTTIEVEFQDLAWYFDHALDSMAEILTVLGSELANEKPALPGANSPFQIVTHCLGVMEFWGGESIAGRDVRRDRSAEFQAVGRVEDLVERIAAQRSRLLLDLESLDSLGPPKTKGAEKDSDLPFARNQAGVVLHVFEELYQHLGHLEITRDLLVSVAGQAT
jgi:Protein of unknown function (DUF664)